MAMRTIQCALSAPAEVRERLWGWTEKYTLLINALLESVAEDPRFPQWLLKGEISQKTLRSDFVKPLKEQSDYSGLPGRFYDSATYITHQVYKSWFAIQSRNYRRLEGKKKWLALVESVAVPTTPDELHTQICRRAAQWLVMAQAQASRETTAPMGKTPSVFHGLMQAAETTTDLVDRQAIIHLLLHNLEVNETPPSPKDLTQRLLKKRIEIERLEAKLHQQLPHGRDPSGQRYLDSLAIATALPNAPQDMEQLEKELKHWRQQSQISLGSPLHYPVSFLSSDSLNWSTLQSASKNSRTNDLRSPNGSRKSLNRRKGPQGLRIGVSFQGFKKDVFKILCDRRQLHIFQRLLAEWQIYTQAIKENYQNPEVIPPALGLYPLRTAQLLWQPDRKHCDATEPWHRHRLYLRCTIDPRLLTAEGTEAVRESKLAICNKKLQKLHEGKEQICITDSNAVAAAVPALHTNTKHQLNYRLRTMSSVQRLERPPLERPHLLPYIGNPDVVMGVSLSRNPPLMVAVVNIQTQTALEYCSARQLLGQRPHKQQGPHCRTMTSQQHLIQRQRYLKAKAQATMREKYAQGRYTTTQRLQRLGLYLDRVLAKRLVEWAMFREVSRIILPRLEGIREVVEGDVRAQARLKFPHYVKLQKQYARSYRNSFHHWSYARLTECIQSCAVNHGIPCEVRILATLGSLQERAVKIALPCD